jgi:hypothetical protein
VLRLAREVEHGRLRPEAEIARAGQPGAGRAEAGVSRRRSPITGPPG